MQKTRFVIATFLCCTSPIYAQNGAPSAPQSASARTPQEVFGEAARKYGALASLRARWLETDAFGGESIWELRFRRISKDNAQIWVRGYDPEDKLTNTFVYDGQKLRHLRTDENDLETEILPPEKGLLRVFGANPMVGLSFFPLLLGENLAADKNKTKASRIENGRVILGAQLFGETQTTRLGYRFDAQNLLREFSLGRTVDGEELGKRFVVQLQTPNAPLKNADFVLSGPPKIQTKFQIEPQARAVFEKSARFYGGLRSWSYANRDYAKIAGVPTKSALFIDFERAGRLRAVYESDFGLSHFVNGTTHWIVDPDSKTYALQPKATGNVALYALTTAGVIPLEISEFLKGSNPLSPTQSEKFFAGYTRVQARKLADANLGGVRHHRVEIVKISPPNAYVKNGVDTTTFWIRPETGAVTRFVGKTVEDGETTNVLYDFSAQKFNVSIPASRFVFSPPRGFKRAK